MVENLLQQLARALDARLALVGGDTVSYIVSLGDGRRSGSSVGVRKVGGMSNSQIRRKFLMEDVVDRIVGAAVGVSVHHGAGGGVGVSWSGARVQFQSSIDPVKCRVELVIGHPYWEYMWFCTLPCFVIDVSMVRVKMVHSCGASTHQAKGGPQGGFSRSLEISFPAILLCYRCV